MPNFKKNSKHLTAYPMSKKYKPKENNCHVADIIQAFEWLHNENETKLLNLIRLIF